MHSFSQSIRIFSFFSFCRVPIHQSWKLSECVWSLFRRVHCSRIESNRILAFLFFFSHFFEFTSRKLERKRKKRRKKIGEIIIFDKSIQEFLWNRWQEASVGIFPSSVSKSLPVFRSSTQRSVVGEKSKFQIESYFATENFSYLFFFSSSTSFHTETESVSLWIFPLFFITGIIPWIQAYLLIPFLIFF